jgi:hypothetical protein
MVLLQEGLEMVEKALSPDLHHIIMPGVLDRKEKLGFGRRGEESLPHGERDDFVTRPVDDEDGGTNPPNLGERVEPALGDIFE